MKDELILAKEIAMTAKKENRKVRIKGFLKNKLAVTGVVITLALLLLGIASPIIAPEGPFVIENANRLQAPSSLNIWGTDGFGRDVFIRTIYGIRISFIIGGATAFITFVLGMILGLLSAYFSWLDQIIMRICDGLMSIPSILMGIALMSALGTSSKNVVIALSIVYTPTVARIARASALSIKEMTYVEAIRSQGARWYRILFKHIAPNVLSPVIVQATYIFATAIILEAALSFLGAGIPAPAPSLGNILSEAKQYIFKAWWITLYPGFCVILLVVGINMLGDGIRDLLDPNA